MTFNYMYNDIVIDLYFLLIYLPGSSAGCSLVLSSTVDAHLAISIVVWGSNSIVHRPQLGTIISVARSSHHSSHTGKHSKSNNSLHDEMCRDLDLL